MKNLSSLGRNLTKKELKLISGGDYLSKEEFDSVHGRSQSGAPGAGVNIRVRSSSGTPGGSISVRVRGSSGD
jgi:bacteriocin-like protein